MKEKKEGAVGWALHLGITCRGVTAREPRAVTHQRGGSPKGKIGGLAYHQTAKGKTAKGKPEEERSIEGKGKKEGAGP